jgi:hypothetical protein
LKRPCPWPVPARPIQGIHLLKGEFCSEIRNSALARIHERLHSAHTQPSGANPGGWIGKSSLLMPHLQRARVCPATDCFGLWSIL